MEEKYQIQLLKESPLFDAEWYKDQYPDVEKVGLTPEQHYLRYGWRMGRNPSASFCGTSYARTYPDVVQKNENPLVHYLRFGINEGREAQPVAQKKASQGNFSIKSHATFLNRGGENQKNSAEAISNQLDETQRLLEKYVRRCHELEYQLMDQKA